MQNKSSQVFKTFHFIKNGKQLENAPVCGLSLKASGSMRFRWNESNSIRSNFFSEVLDKNQVPVPVELNHTKIVYDVESSKDTYRKIGDGIITKNKALVPTITVADCVPIFLYDSVTGCFGIVHSGWKGTGIAVEAVRLASATYSSKPEDFSVVIGPHIHDCCYIVDEKRASYFEENFGNCTSQLSEGERAGVKWNNGEGPLFRLSLARANVNALIKAGVPASNISVSEHCTCCYKDPEGDEVYGSNRRETSVNAPGGVDLSNDQIPPFTVMAAFIGW